MKVQKYAGASSAFIELMRRQDIHAKAKAKAVDEVTEAMNGLREASESKMRENIPPRFPVSLRVRCPEALPPLIESAAQLQMMTPAEYIRRAIFEKLERDREAVKRCPDL